MQSVLLHLPNDAAVAFFNVAAVVNDAAVISLAAIINDAAVEVMS